jgi:hypothetical protein
MSIQIKSQNVKLHLNKRASRVDIRTYKATPVDFKVLHEKVGELTLDSIWEGESAFTKVGLLVTVLEVFTTKLNQSSLRIWN